MSGFPCPPDIARNTSTDSTTASSRDYGDSVSGLHILGSNMGQLMTCCRIWGLHLCLCPEKGSNVRVDNSRIQTQLDTSQGKRCLLWNISGRGEQRIKNYWKMLGHGSWRLGPLIASSSCSHDCNPLALPSVPNSLDPRLNTHAPKQNEHRMNMNKQYLPRMATPISSAEWRMCNIPWIRMCCKYNLPGIKHIVKPCKTIQCCSSDKPAFSARCSQSKPASTSPAWRGCGCVFALGTWHAKLLLTKSSIASIDYELCIKLTTA